MKVKIIGGNYDIAVLIKQVPVSNDVSVDPENNMHLYVQALKE